jgi:hypothetical protein
MQRRPNANGFLTRDTNFSAQALGDITPLLVPTPIPRSGRSEPILVIGGQLLQAVVDNGTAKAAYFEPSFPGGEIALERPFLERFAFEKT